MYLSRFANMLWFIFGCSGVVKKVRYKNVEEAVQYKNVEEAVQFEKCCADLKSCAASEFLH